MGASSTPKLSRGSIITHRSATLCPSKVNELRKSNNIVTLTLTLASHYGFGFWFRVRVIDRFSSEEGVSKSNGEVLKGKGKGCLSCSYVWVCVGR